MAEPIGLASGLLTLVTFAFQSGVTLYNTVQSFQSHTKRVRDLMQELEALTGVLGPLTDTIRATTNLDLSALDLPLLRCGNSCKDFERELVKCSSLSGNNRTSFRDWAKLRYMGEDIDGFRRLLAGYKATINIALADANLRNSKVNAESLESYKDLLKATTEDLEVHLESIDEKLEAIFARSVAESDSDAAERRMIKEEQLSTQRCLQICAQLSDHINQLQISPKGSDGSEEAAPQDTYSEKVTNVGLQECKNSLTLTAARLEKHMQDLMKQLVAKSKTTMGSEEEVVNLVRLQDEWETTLKCIDICSKAENHLHENVSNIENYATGDAVQFMVSTEGKTLHGKNRGYGWRTRQYGGHMSDLSVQQLSRDLTNVSIQNLDREIQPPKGDTPLSSENVTGNKPRPGFQQRYGPGNKLPAEPSMNKPSTGSEDSGRRSNSP